jgi:hypothetical protein
MELLANICSYLYTPDARRFRLINRSCAAIGIDFIMPILHFRIDWNDMHRLEAITQHHILPNRIKTLEFNGSILPIKASRLADWTSANMRANSTQFKKLTEMEKTRGYQEFCRLLNCQNDLIKSNRVSATLKNFFAKAKNLEKIRFLLPYDNTYIDPDKARKAFLEGLVPKTGPGDTHAAGGFVALLRALSKSNSTVKSVEASMLSWRFLKSRALFEGLTPSFTTSVSELRLGFASVDSGLYYEIAEWEHDDGRIFLQKSKALSQLLVKFSNLKILRIGVDYFDKGVWDDLIFFKDIDDQTHTWPLLRELRLDGVGATAAGLVHFLQRHKGTLEILELDSIHLNGIGDSWLTFLPEVRKTIKLKQAFIGGPLSSYTDADTWYLNPPEESKIGQRIARYLIYGGRIPLIAGDFFLEDEMTDDEDEELMDLWLLPEVED